MALPERRNLLMTTMYWIVVLLATASAAHVADLLLPHSHICLWIISQSIIFIAWKLSNTENSDHELSYPVNSLLETWYDDAVPFLPTSTSWSGPLEIEPLPPEVTKEVVVSEERSKSAARRRAMRRRHCRVAARADAVGREIVPVEAAPQVFDREIFPVEIEEWRMQVLDEEIAPRVLDKMIVPVAIKEERRSRVFDKEIVPVEVKEERRSQMFDNCKEMVPVMIKEEATAAARWQRKEVVVADQDELFLRAEVFIKKHYDSLRLQRREEFESLPWLIS